VTNEDRFVPEAAAERRRPPREADVILDVEFEDGLLFLVLENIGFRPAHAVRVRFGGPLRGLGGEKRIDRLRIFQRLELLPRGSGSGSSSTAPRCSSPARSRPSSRRGSPGATTTARAARGPSATTSTWPSTG
jgi:hypothetical protein